MFSISKVNELEKVNGDHKSCSYGIRNEIDWWSEQYYVILEEGQWEFNSPSPVARQLNTRQQGVLHIRPE